MRTNLGRAAAWLLAFPALTAGFSLADSGSTSFASGLALAAAKALLVIEWLVNARTSRV